MDRPALEYLQWLRHPEHFDFHAVFPDEACPLLYRGLKEDWHLWSELLRNGGIPVKGAVWVTNDAGYARQFGTALVLEIDPLRLGALFPESFLQDRETTFTSGKPINIYRCLRPTTQQIILSRMSESTIYGPYSGFVRKLFADI